jgi:1,5-anhydro-D-fructose reductase (1,5-anhydro-D-mannitol-forming)
MAACAEGSGQLLGVAYFRRLYPKVLRARRLLAEGAIGRPTFAFACYHGWLESDERAWLKDPALAGGGPFFDVASHRIDLLNFLLGAPLCASGLLSNALHQIPVEDSGTSLIGYGGGIHAVVDARWNSHVSRDEFRIVGVDGELNLTPLNGASLKVIPAAGEVREESLPTHANVHYPLIENFVTAVLEGGALACPIREAIQTDWVTERVFRA